MRLLTLSHVNSRDDFIEVSDKKSKENFKTWPQLDYRCSAHLAFEQRSIRLNKLSHCNQFEDRLIFVLPVLRVENTQILICLLFRLFKKRDGDAVRQIRTSLSLPRNA